MFFFFWVGEGGRGQVLENKFTITQHQLLHIDSI